MSGMPDNIVFELFFTHRYKRPSESYILSTVEGEREMWWSGEKNQ